MPLDKELNKKHVNNPRVGDYWQEMLCPILLVLGVSKKEKTVTIVKEKTEIDANYWTWDLDKFENLKLEEFKKYLLYNTDDPDLKTETWADVMPKADRHEPFIKQFRNAKRRNKT